MRHEHADLGEDRPRARNEDEPEARAEHEPAAEVAAPPPRQREERTLEQLPDPRHDQARRDQEEEGDCGVAERVLRQA